MKPKTIREVLEELDTRCPKCDDEGNGGDGCPYCWDNDVKRQAIDNTLAQIQQLLEECAPEYRNQDPIRYQGSLDKLKEAIAHNRAIDQYKSNLMEKLR